MNDEPNIPDRDELHDRLIDCGLEELVDGAKAPDLRERILAAAAVTARATVTRAPITARREGERSRVRWAALAIAVCLMVAAAAGLLVPALRDARESARRELSPASGQRLERVKLQESDQPILVEQARSGEQLQDLESERQAITERLRLGVPVNSDGSEVQAAGEEQVLLSMAVNSDVEGRVNLNAAPMAGESSEAASRYGSPPLASPLVVDEAQPEAGVVPLSTVAPRADELGEVTSEQSSGQQASGPPSSLASLPLGLEAEGRGSSRGRRLGENGTSADVEQLYMYEGEDAGEPIAETLAWHDSRYGDVSGGQASADADSYGLDVAGSARGGRRGGYGRDKLDRSLYFGDATRLTTDSWDKGKEFQLGFNRGGGDRYAAIVDNPFQSISAATTDNRLSTFSIDVDTASYANVRQFLMQGNRLPPPDAVRIEELINYFDYDYKAPGDSDEPVAYNSVMAEARVEAAKAPFAANIEVAGCPWTPKHRLVRIGIKGREIARTQRPKSNLVFLVDVSGSMDEPQKLPLLVEGMRMLTRELGENDRVAIVVYASTEGLALDSTRGDEQEVILAALDRLSAGGSTAGGAGIQLAYKVAAQNFIKGGVNRVILCTDGDFNVGVTDVEALQQLAADKAKDTGVFLTVLGFGRGNLNDALMEAVADHGNGNYHYVDNRSEARKVLVEEMAGTLVTIAKDVKIQIEFNPAKVAGYRLIGYENRVLAAQDFNDDTKDAGEIGAGHTVTALYEIVPAGQTVGIPATDDLKYAPPVPPSRESEAAAESAPEKYNAAESSDELLTLKIRYKLPDGDESTKLEFPATDGGQAFAAASADFQFASAVAGFGMRLRGSQYKGDATFAGMLEIAESATGDRDPHGYRREFVEMVSQAKRLAGE